MGRNDLKAKIRLEGDAKGANKAIASTGSRFKRLTQTIKTSALAQVAALGGVVLAIRGLGRAISSSIKLAAEQERAFNALEGALAPLGDEATKVAKALAADAAALQQVSRFGDETIIQAQALIASFVREESQIKAATRATIDLAEAKGFSLVSAADLVSKTLGSTTNALTRYGIEVIGAVGSTERLSSLTENVAKVFGGRGLKATKTFAGAMDQLKNSVGDAKEGLGQAITENEGFLASIRNTTKLIQDNQETFVAAGEAVVKFAVGIGKATVAVTGFLNSFGGRIGEALVQSIKLFGSSLDTVEVSTDALINTSLRLGISVEELELRIAQGIGTNRKLNESLKTSASSQSAAAKAALEHAEAQAKLDETSKMAATAMEELGNAIGLVTSSELVGEIIEIETKLEAARIATGGFGREFIEAEQIASARIETLKLRIQSLKDGTGDLTAEVETAAGAFDTWGTSVNQTGTQLQRTTGFVNQFAASVGQADQQVRALTQTQQRQITLASRPGVGERQPALFQGLSKGGTFTVFS